MTRPRIAAVVSAIVASTAAFAVVRRWDLAGTLGGAAIIPVIYSLVSHWSAESLDRFGLWMHRRASVPQNPGEPNQAAAGGSARSGRREADAGQSAATDATQGRNDRGARVSLAWWSLTVVSLVALAVGVYSLTVAGRTERPLVQEKVVERTVVVTVPDTGTKILAQTKDTSTTSTEAVGSSTTASTVASSTTSSQTGTSSTTTSSISDTGPPDTSTTPASDPEQAPSLP